MHTKGPWKALPTHDAGTVPYIESAHRTIAVMVPSFNNKVVTKEDFDNARLMATAPKLLEALEGAVHFITSMGMKIPEDVTRIIAKAKGLLAD